MAVWATIEDALRVWVKAGSGLGDAKVIWLDQTGARPAAPFIELKLGDIVPLGGVDPVETATDLMRPAGTEIELKVAGVRAFTVSLQAYTATVTGAATARALLSLVQTALSLPSVRAALDAAGVTPFDEGEVHNLTGLLGTKFEGRAALDVQFYVRETLSEFTGFIGSCVPTPTFH